MKLLAVLLHVALSLALVPIQDAAPGEPRGPAARRTELVARDADPADALDRVEQVAVDAWLRRHPWEARELGVPGYDAALGQFTFGEREAWLRKLDELAVALRDVDERRLAPERRMDHDRLDGWIRARTLLDHSLPHERRDPSFYPERVLRSLQSLLRAGDLDAERVAAMTVLLRKVPGALATGRTQLAGPDERWIERGRQHARALQLFLEIELYGTVAAALGALAEDERTAFLEGLRDAARASAEYATFVSELEPGVTRNEWLLDEDTWTGIVRGFVGADWDVDALRVRLNRDTSDYDLALRTTPLEDDPGAASPAPDQLWREATHGQALAKQDAVGANLAPPILEDPRPYAAPSLLPGPRFLDVRSHGGASHVAAIHLPGPGWDPAIAADWASYLDPQGLRALGVQTGVAGETGVLIGMRRGSSRTREALRNDALVAGAGLYSLDALARVNWVEVELPGQTGLLLASQRFRLLEAARLRATLDLHVRHVPPAEVAETFRGLTGASPATAEHEVFECLRDPMRGGAYLAYLELQALERTFEEHGGSPIQAMRRVFVTLRNHPGVRPVDVIANDDLSRW